MWKVLYILFVIIVFTSCQALVTVSLSTNTTNEDYDDQAYESTGVNVPDYQDDYEPSKVEYEEGKLIGKWKSNGAAIEPKWRDGDSIPRVPFKEIQTQEKAEFPSESPSTQPVKLQQSFIDSKISQTDFHQQQYNFNHTKDHTQTDSNVKTDDSSSYNNYANLPRNGSQRYRNWKQQSMTEEEEKHEPIDQKNRQESVGRFENSENNNHDKIREIRNYASKIFQAQPEDYEINEEYERPRPRKRRPPQNYEFTHTNNPINVSLRKKSNTTNLNRNNYSRVSGIDEQKASENSELKSLLKMQESEGLSLSEILQRRNLTLNDLLKGKSEVIDALKSNDGKNRERNMKDVKEYRLGVIRQVNQGLLNVQQPRWSIKERLRDLKRNQVESTIPKVNFTVQVTSQTDKPTLVLSGDDNNLRKLNDKERFSTVVRTKPVIRPWMNSFTGKFPLPVTVVTTTTRSIARVPVTVQYNSGKRTMTTTRSVDEDEIMEFSDFYTKNNAEVKVMTPLPTTISTKTQSTTKKIQPSTITSYYNDIDRDIGSTLSIEHILSPTISTVSTLVTPMNSNLDSKSNSLIEEDLFDAGVEMEYQNDGPTTENDEINTEKNLSTVTTPVEALKNHRNTFESNHQSLNNKMYEEIISDVEPETRAEIFELISTGSSAERLEKLLKSRNMSIDELIKLRQRGSSQLHLAQISQPRSHTQTTKPSSSRSSISVITTITEPFSTRKIPKTTVSFETTEKNIINNSKSFIAVDKEPVIIKLSPEYRETNSKIDRNKIELVELLSAFDSLPFKIEVPTTRERKLSTSTEINIVQSTAQVINNISTLGMISDVKNEHVVPTVMMEAGLVEEIAKEIEAIDSEESLPKFDDNYEFNNIHQDDDRVTLSRVRPSIIASGAILGMTIVGFLAIFIICRIRQKQRYMYKNSFSKTVFQTPVMNARKLSNSSSLNTIMVNVVATSTIKRSIKQETQEVAENFESKSDIEHDSLDANDSWETIPEFMK